MCAETHNIQSDRDSNSGQLNEVSEKCRLLFFFSLCLGNQTYKDLCIMNGKAKNQYR